MRGHLVALADDLGGVQQRLGRDAADIEADATQRRPALDQHHLLAEIGGAERGRVAAGPGAQDQHLGVQVARRRDRRPRGRSRRRRLGDRRIVGLGLGGTQQEDEVALGDPIARLDLDLGRRARGRRGNLQGRLVGLQGDQRVLGLDHGARLDVDLDDRDVLEIADVRDLDLDHVIEAARRAVVRRTAPGGWRGVLLDPLLGRDGCRTVRLEEEDEVALGDAVAGLDRELMDGAGLGAGTSMVALSDSRVISGSSTLTLAPGATCTSMIGMSLKSPMSGTRISIVLIGISPQLG